MVDAGGEPVQVVCGAPNARTGMKSVFSPVGTYIPGKKITLAKGVIRGVESNGMLCSAAELELSDDHDGIIDLPDDAPVGVAYASLCRPRRSGHRRRADAQPARRDRRLRHRPRSRRRRPRRTEDAAPHAGRGRLRLPDQRAARFRRRRRASLPGLRAASGARRHQRRFAGMDAEAAARDRPAADQRAGRHHQLSHLRSRPAAACLRSRQGQGRAARAPRPRRRERAGARRQDLRARREHGRRSPTRTASNRSPA